MEFRELTFEEELKSLLNRYGKERGSNTPDFILAAYLLSCLATWEARVNERDRWYQGLH